MGDSNFEGRKMRRCSPQGESWIQVLRLADTDEDQISVMDSLDLVDKVDKEDKLNMENMVRSQVDKTSQIVEDKIGLWDASRRGLLHKVRSLLERNPGSRDLNRKVREYQGGAFVSPLLLAARGGHLAVCKCLLEAGAQVDRDTLEVAQRMERKQITQLLATYV